MAKKKVLIVVHQLNIGGVQKALLSALDAIDYQRAEVTLYIRKDRTELLHLVNKNVKQIIVNRDDTKYYRRPYPAWCIARIKLLEAFGRDTGKLKKKLSNVINRRQCEYEKKHYFQDGTVYDLAVSYIQGSTALFVADYVDAKRKVMFFHGSTDEEHELHERILHRFEAVYCVSQPAMEAIASYYPEEKERFRCLENIVDAENVRRMAKEKPLARKKDGTLILCTCGRMTKVKGFDLAVEAASVLKRNGLTFLWYFVGDGPEREMIEEKIIEAGLSDNIVLAGMQRNPYPYMDACDIYVQPSREEAHSISLIESQVLCIPAVSTLTAGGRALIRFEETGILTDISAGAIAEGILKLVTDETMRRRIKEELSGIDYKEKERIFKEQWERMLCDNDAG